MVYKEDWFFPPNLFIQLIIYLYQYGFMCIYFIICVQYSTVYSLGTI